MKLMRLREDTKGATLVEFAFAAPVLIAIMVGSLQMGLVLYSSGGMRHAVGEGVRYAKVYPNATEEQVLEKVKTSYSGIDPAKVSTLVFERGLSSKGAPFAKISMSYEVAPMIPFVPMPPFTLSEEKLVYLPS